MLAFISIRLLDILDIVLVAFLLYELYNLLRGTAAINIFLGILAVLLTWRLVTALEMELLSKIFGGFISVGFIALIVVFQPEIRRFLLLLGTPYTLDKIKSRLFFWKMNIKTQPKVNFEAIVKACQSMSEQKTGALIILAKKNELKQLIETGQRIDAVISTALLENIFFKNSPLHDGAVIIDRNKIKAARCVLPITRNRNFPSNYGLRHRAAVGVSEQTDAIALIVSEESGKISYAKGGALYLHLTPTQLRNYLNEEFSA